MSPYLDRRLRSLDEVLTVRRAARRGEVRTYRNTRFSEWKRQADEAFKALGLEEPDCDTAFDAYELGECPETFAAYVANS